jgi:hypothetical protein
MKIENDGIKKTNHDTASRFFDNKTSFEFHPILNYIVPSVSKPGSSSVIKPELKN